MSKEKIWITWEGQRRSLELANALQAKLFVLSDADNLVRPLRYFVLSIKTLFIILKEKPKIIFAQNPSMVLPTILSFFRIWLSYRLVVDRHSNFKFHTIRSKKVIWKIFHFLSRYTIRNADLTIVSNDYLCNIVNKWEGYGFVLQDKLPKMALGENIKLKGKKNIVFVATFSNDEPIAEIIGAAKLLNKEWIIYLTGKYDNFYNKKILTNLPENVRLTNFLSEKRYESLLLSSDLMVVLTKQEHTLNCGAYEGVAIGKPMILSDTDAIKSYFSKGVIYSKCDSISIATAIKEGILKSDEMRKDIKLLKKELLIKWEIRFNQLLDIMFQVKLDRIQKKRC